MAAAANRSGAAAAAAHCHRAGPGPGPGGQQQQKEEEEEEDEDEAEERRSRRQSQQQQQQQQAPALGLAAPCMVKQEQEEKKEEQQEDEAVVEVEVEVQEEEEQEQARERERARARARARARSGVSGRDRQQFPAKRRILIVDGREQLVEEAVLCQEADWDRADGQAGGPAWQRPAGWGQAEAAKVATGSLRGREQRQQKQPQGPTRDRPGAAPAQRRRKSEYPRRRSCISFTFSGAEPTGGRPEEGEEPMDSRDLQRFGAAHRENGEAPASRQDLRTCGEALGDLVGWAHRHCQGCLHLPSLRYLPPSGTAPAVWACQAGHTYRWRAAGRSPRRRGRRRATKTGGSAAGASESHEVERGPSSELEAAQEVERSPSSERVEAKETERGLSSEREEEEESDRDYGSEPVASLRIVECELEEGMPGGRGPQPGWKVIPCKVERSEEEEAEEGLDPIEPLPELPVLKTAPVVLMKTRPGRGQWRAKSACEEPESNTAPEPKWEAHYWEEASPSAYAAPEIRTHAVNRRDLAGERAVNAETDMEAETMQLICESVPDQKDESITLAGLAAAAGLPDSIREPELVKSEEEEAEFVETDDDIPFHDDPKDAMYEPSPHRERAKQRRRPRKEKETLEMVEQVEPPKRRPRRAKEDRGPRLPKKRKKPPIQYVRCEMEGCGTILANPRYLQHHMRYQHMLKKKYVCPHPSCGRLFRLQKQLLRHTKHHSDQRDYICEYCARAFKSSHNLAVHRMIHTGEKPLQCEICGFTCRQKASLNWHMKKHDADANYQFSCNVCGKKFEKKDSVVAHKSKSHPELVIAEALAESAEIVQS